MPRIPESEARTQLPVAPRLGANIRGAAAVGQAIERGFSELGSAQAALAGTLQRQREKSEAVTAAKTVAETRAFWQRQLIERAEAAPGDAAGFHDQVLKDFDTDVAARLETAPETARDFLDVRLAELREDIGTKAATIEGRARTEKRARDLAAIVDLNANSVRTDETQFEPALAEALGAITALELPEARAAEAQTVARSQIARALLQGLNERDPERAKELLASGIHDQNLTAKDKNTLVNDNQVELRRRELEARQERARVEAERRALRTELRDEVRGAVKIMGEGFNPGSQVFVDLETRARQLDDPDTVAMLQDAKALNVFRLEAGKLTPADLQTFVNREQARLADKPASEGVNTFEVQRLQLAEGLLQTMNREIGKDPLTFANRVGVIRLEPLRIFDQPAEEGETVAGVSQARGSIIRRISHSLLVSQHYGVAPRFLTDEEATQLSGAFESTSVDGQLALLATISQGFGDHTPDILTELKNDKPAVAHVGGLLTVQSPPETARDALTGLQALATGNVVLPTATDIDEWSDDVLGAAFGSVPSTRSAVIETAKGIYHTRAVRRGATGPDELDEALWKRAIQEAAGAIFTPNDVQFGGITSWRGNEVVVPSYIAADDFGDVIRRLEDQDLALASDGGGEPKHLDGAAFTAEDLQDDAYLVSIGHGRYLVSMTNPVDGPPEWVLGTGPNGHYVLDLGLISRQVAAGTRGITLPLSPADAP